GAGLAALAVDRRRQPGAVHRDDGRGRDARGSARDDGSPGRDDGDSGCGAGPAVAAPNPGASPAPATASPPAAPAARPATAPAPPPAGPRVVIKALADCWIQVRAPDQTVVFSRVLKSGETYKVPARPGLFLRTGNAGALEITVDGKP